MKQKRNLLLPLLLLLLGSCTMGDEAEESMLTLTPNEEVMSVPWEASESVITVSTNRSRWTVIKNAEWVSVEQSGNSLTIRIAANESDQPRKSALLVTAGDAHAHIDIEQEGAPLTIDTYPNELSFGWEARVLYVDVMTNAYNWTATTDADWIGLTPMPLKHQILLTLEENSSEEPRMGKITISGLAGEGGYDLTVTQDGCTWVNNETTLPYLDFVGADKAAITEFEFGRNSVLYLDMLNLYCFTTTNQKFPYVEYHLRDRALMYVYMVAAAPYVMSEESEAIIEMLASVGYTEKQKYQSTYDAYYNAEANALAVIYPSGSIPGIQFFYYPPQDKAYPTYEKVPQGFFATDYEGLSGVQEYEKSLGGIQTSGFVADNPQPPSQMFETTGQNPSRRVYFFDYSIDEKEGRVVRFRQVFEDTEEFVWFYRDFPILTNEFQALMKEEGFQYTGYEFLEGAYTFFNDRANMTAEIMCKRYFGEENYTVSLTLGKE